MKRAEKRLSIVLVYALVLFFAVGASAGSDLSAYMRGKRLRMWVNDDADVSDSEEDPNDVPKQSNAYNYYSSGEDVLTNGNGTAQTLLSGSYAWYNQESRKGQWPMLLPGNNEAGWSFNGAYDTLMFHMSPENAADLSDDVIRTNSFFGLFDERGLYGTNGSVLATQPIVRRHALADGIPAESYAAGANWLGRFGLDRNVNMPDVAINAWERLYGVGHNQSWRHSDIKKRPYQAVRDVFLSIIEKGNLR